jgi:hypothetical protein
MAIQRRWPRNLDSWKEQEIDSGCKLGRAKVKRTNGTPFCPWPASMAFHHELIPFLKSMMLGPCQGCQAVELVMQDLDLPRNFNRQDSGQA